MQVTVVEKCNCKFHWCCEVRCEECIRTYDVYTCKSEPTSTYPRSVSTVPRPRPVRHHQKRSKERKKTREKADHTVNAKPTRQRRSADYSKELILNQKLDIKNTRSGLKRRFSRQLNENRHIRVNGGVLKTDNRSHLSNALSWLRYAKKFLFRELT